MAFAKDDLLGDYVRGIPLGMMADKKQAARILVNRIGQRHGIEDVELVYHPHRTRRVVASVAPPVAA